MKCEELLKALGDYVDGEIDPSFCAEFEHHLEGCNPCQVVIDNIRKTVALYQGDKEYPLPEEFHKRLCDCLRARWEKKFAK
jgi:anti-sigma factor RsiW